MPSSRGDETKPQWLTQNRTGVGQNEICMAHPTAMVALTFPKHAAQWMFTQCEKERKKKSIRYCDLERGVKGKKNVSFLTIDKNQSVSSRRDQAAHQPQTLVESRNQVKMYINDKQLRISRTGTHCVLCRIRATCVQPKRTNNKQSSFSTCVLAGRCMQSYRTEQRRLCIQAA